VFYNFHDDYREIAGGKQALTPAAEKRFLSCQIFPESVKLGGRSNCKIEYGLTWKG
jgi:hypothetical protein